MRHPAAGVTELARVPRRNLVEVRYFDAAEIRTRDLCARSPPLYHYAKGSPPAVTLLDPEDYTFIC